MQSSSRSAFTLIELLVVIAIIAILAVVVVLTLNPAQLLAQSRDANRVSDMATLNSAINLYATDQSGSSGYSLGVASTSYLSIPSASSSCATLGLATSAFSYACSTSGNYRNASSSGWIPLNFQSISAGSPLGNLPVDPVNTSSSNLYYSYETNGSQYVLSSFMESSKYAKNMMTTGGVDPALYEAGSGATTLPDATRGLVGYWPLNEGSGSSTIDWSGYGNNGTWNGTPTGTSGYYSAGHPWQWGGAFDGSSTYVGVGTAASLQDSKITISAWIYPTSLSRNPEFIAGYGNTGVIGYWIATGGNNFIGDVGNGTVAKQFTSVGTLSLNTWTYVAMTYDGTNQTLYINGQFDSNSTAVSGNLGGYGSLSGSALGFDIGNITGLTSTRFFPGFVSDVRVYDRALSAAEIQEIYNAEK